MLYHRIDLHDALKEAATASEGAGAPATIRVSSRVVDIDPDEGTVTLADGETLKADLIIGADGM